MNTTRLLVRQPPRRRRRLGRLCVAAVVGSALAASAGEAAATVTLSQDVDRTKGERPTAQYPLWISHEDCVGENDLRFRVTLSGHQSSDTLSVWVSESLDCTLYSNRDTGTRCRQVLATSNLEPTMDIVVPAKAIAAALGAEGCDDERASTGPVSVTMYFMRQVSLQEDATDYATWTETKMDLKGPRPPSNVQTGSGDGRLIVSFKQNTDQDVRGYYFYCDANAQASTGATGGGSGGAADGAGGSGGAGEGGARDGSGAGDDGSGTSSGGDSGCGSAVLIPGEIPDARYQCGKVGRSGSGEASGLSNGNTYVVGVAAYDLLGNAGTLSELACGTPVDVDGFFELYRQAGGQGGGGYCSVGGPVGAARWASLPLGVITASAALGLWRRSRRRRGRPFMQEHE